ncbi:MAG: GDSL-type esterase/lipase family protein [Planctomycetaceae bacterium]|nr:GDSL-type esterase/lipase family protein [Planctomycetaceae bacterium]
MTEPASDRQTRIRTSRPKRRRSRAFRCGAGLIVAAAVLVSLELSVRALTADPGSRRFQQINQIVLFLGTHESDLMLDADPERFWKLKPGVRIEDSRNDFWKGRVSNSLGFRNPEFEIARKEGSLRIVCFGDSSTFGIGNRMAETWPAQLETQLRSTDCSADFSQIEVINAGVPGYSSWQGLQHMRQEIGRLQPDIVLASYANNDFWHWDDATDRAHAERFRQSTLRSVLLRSRVACLFDDLLSQLRQPGAEALQSPSPNKRWAQTATVNYVSPIPQWTRRVPLDDFRNNLSAMADLCGEHQAACIFVKWPDQPLASGQGSPREEYHEVLGQIAAERRLAVADVVASFQRHPWSVDTYIPNDIVHVDRAGNALAAQAALAAVRQVLGTPGSTDIGSPGPIASVPTN